VGSKDFSVFKAGGAALQRFLQLGSLLAAIGFAALLGGCGGGSVEGESGDVWVGLTDAAGDFATYTVDVTAITLKKANGVVVETLPLQTTVDFAQYVDMTEFLTAATVPSGFYVAGTLSLDYSNAVIQVENAAGEIVDVDRLIDSDGNPVTSLDVEVKLEEHNRLLIAPGIPANLTLDFDLNVSHRTEFGSEVVSTIEPVLIAEVDAERPKPHRVRGPLKQVDEAAGSYTVVMRPFHHRLSSDERFGTLQVQTTDATLFEIDGQSYTGAAGLSALAAMPAFTATIAVGDLKFGPRRFEATEVYAGSSVPGGDSDVVTGDVVTRSGDILTVKGATLVRSDGSVIFRDQVSVTLGDNTQVKKQLSSGDFSKDEISVGQRLRVFGTLTETTPGNLVMDASEGLVRMHLTTLRGTVAENSVDGFAMVVDRFSHRKAEAFDFSGTGLTAEQDADPNHYEIDTSSLNTSSFTIAAAMRARGFVTPFGSAPADFTAQTLEDLSALPAVLVVSWDPASAAGVSIVDQSLLLNLEGMGRFHHISQAGARIDLLGLEGDFMVVQGSNEVGLYSIVQPDGPVALHTSFAAFLADLQSRLNNGAAVRRLLAPGSYAGEMSHAARRMIIQVE
jgi:hypothetical protein